MHHFDLQCATLDERHCALTVIGELDIGTSSAFRSTLGDLMGTGQRDVLVDLGQTDFLDSSGIGVLLWAHHRLEAAGGHLVVVNAHGGVARTLEITGAARMLFAKPAPVLN
jgi:anti-sigma B factor antagonist